MLGTLLETPVMLNPGRARLFAKPLPTGSNAATNTIGMVVVCLRAASIAGLRGDDHLDLASSRSVTIAGSRSTRSSE